MDSRPPPTKVTQGVCRAQGAPHPRDPGARSQLCPEMVALQRAGEASVVDAAFAAQTPLQDRGCVRGKGRILHLNQAPGLPPKATGGSAGSPSQRVVSLKEAPPQPGL